MSAPVSEVPFDVPEDELPPLPAIDLHNLHAGYGRVEVLHGIDLVVPRGSVVALMGPNGAGKTTTLNTIAGFVRPTQGCVHVAGLHINNVSPEARAKAGVCSIPEGRGVFPNLSVNENLRVFTHAGNKPFDEVQERAFSRFTRLGERRNQLAGTLSGGERQMLAMCRAFVTDPAILLVDEISMGLAPIIVEQLYEVLGQLAAEGIAILVVEQFVTAISKVADFAAVMRLGRIEAVGEPDDITDLLSEAYLGSMS